MAIFKKILSGVSKIGKGAVGVVKGVAKGVKKAAGTKIGKAVLVGAAIYTGYGLLGGASGIAAMQASSPILYGALQGGAIGALAGAATGKDENILKGALLGGAVGGGAAYFSGGATAGAGSGTYNGDMTLTPEAQATANATAYLNAGAGAGAGGAGAATVAGGTAASGAGISGWAANNPMMAYGAVQGGLGLLQGYAEGNAAQAAMDEQTRQDQIKFDRSQISNVPGYEALLGIQGQQAQVPQGTPNVLNPQTLLPQVLPTAAPVPVPGQTQWAQR